VDERALNELRSLAARDAELAERRRALQERDAQIAAIRGRAEAIEAFFAAHPAEEARRRGELEDAEAELAARRDELARAERQLADAREEEARELAERAVGRARDHIAVAQSRVDRAEAARDELARDATTLPQELEALRERAGGPDGSLVEWASRTHADVFVAGGQLDTERERIGREANELASLLLGEPTYGATPAQALERVERLTNAPRRQD
jgi:DNA repair exonuclease SbcCD ATPase subunit